MAAGRLRAVVATSSLDLGIDWGDVDLVINVGAPKGASRLLQRIGRANHRMDEPSRGVLVPANRFEVLECRAAIDGGRGECAGHAAAAHRRARRAGAARARLRLRRAVPRRRALRRGDDRRALCGADARRFRRHGRFRRDRRLCAEILRALRQDQSRPRTARWRIAHPRVAQMYRMNVGTIVEADMLKVRLVRSRASKVIPRGGRAARPGRGIFRRDHDAGRHLRVRRRGAEIRGDRRGRGLRLALARSRSEGAVLRGRQVSALDLPGRPRAQHPRRPRTLARAARSGARMAGGPGMALAPAGHARAAGRDLPARREILPRLLSVRGPARAPDARHAADAAARARAHAPARLRGERICARGLGPARRGARDRARRALARRRCSTRTCSATTSRPGSPSPR